MNHKINIYHACMRYIKTATTVSYDNSMTSCHWRTLYGALDKFFGQSTGVDFTSQLCKFYTNVWISTSSVFKIIPFNC